MDVKRYGNLILGLFFMSLSAIYFFLTSQLPDSPVGGLGPRFAPNIIAAITFGVALLLTITSIQEIMRTRAEAEEKEQLEYRRVFLSMFVFCCYVYSFGPLGFPVATFIYLVAQMVVMAPKEKVNIPLFLFIALVTTGLVYYLFRYQLDVLLPQGIFDI